MPSTSTPIASLAVLADMLLALAGVLFPSAVLVLVKGARQLGKLLGAGAAVQVIILLTLLEMAVGLALKLAPAHKVVTLHQKSFPRRTIEKPSCTKSRSVVVKQKARRSLAGLRVIAWVIGYSAGWTLPLEISPSAAARSSVVASPTPLVESSEGSLFSNMFKYSLSVPMSSLVGSPTNNR